MNILYATSEAYPFIKSGGLGDCLGALPAQISKLENISVSVCLPYYSSIKNNPEFDIQFVTNFYVPLSWRNVYAGIFKATVKTRTVGKNKGADVTFYFIDNEAYFGRSGIYGFIDDGERFAFFSKAVLEMLGHIDLKPDVIHCNDWQTGFIPLFLKAHYSNIDCMKKIKTVFTIHNIEYQGKAEPSFLSEVLGVDEYYRNIATHDNMINSMKCAVVLCDRLTTVSQTYSHEISFAYFAHGLERIISENEYKTCGIVNGIDCKVYDPKSDSNIISNYTSTNLFGKSECKRELQRELSLPVSDDIPVIAIVSRLVSHKGLELVEWVADNLANMNIQLVVLGTGDKKFEEMFKFLAFVHHESVSANIRFDSALASRIYAGADFLLMPSKSEPCGLSQLISMRYGTIPIVRETGGLVDTVTPINTDTLEGCGFTFKLYNAHDMLGAVERARDFFYEKEKLQTVRKSLMKLDLSWRKPAEKYYYLYKELIGKEN